MTARLLHEASGLPYVRDRLITVGQNRLARMHANPLVEHTINSARTNMAWDKYKTLIFILKPPILSGKAAHGGVALLWKVAIDDDISPPDNIKSDRIVGIQCEFPGHILTFMLGVYLPSASHNLEEYGEYFDYLWALYDSLSSNGKVILMDDFNGDLGNSLGNEGRCEPNQRGLKLLNLAHYFNMCPVNLMNMCTGPLETFNSFC